MLVGIEVTDEVNVPTGLVYYGEGGRGRVGGREWESSGGGVCVVYRPCYLTLIKGSIHKSTCYNALCRREKQIKHSD